MRNLLSELNERAHFIDHVDVGALQVVHYGLAPAVDWRRRSGGRLPSLTRHQIRNILLIHYIKLFLYLLDEFLRICNEQRGLHVEHLFPVFGGITVESGEGRGLFYPITYLLFNLLQVIFRCGLFVLGCFLWSGRVIAEILGSRINMTLQLWWRNVRTAYHHIQIIQQV